MFNVAVAPDVTDQQMELYLMAVAFQEGFWVAGWPGVTVTSADRPGT